MTANGQRALYGLILVSLAMSSIGSVAGGKSWILFVTVPIAVGVVWMIIKVR